jgi:tyrosine-protein phosphatase YwqE
VATVDALAAGGRGCIIAHPERHASDDLRARLAALIERGALVQVTAALLADDDAAAGMLQLAESGLVHLLASDAHTARAGRPVALSAGLAALARVEWLRPHLAWMVREAPEHVLRGSPVQPPFAPR